MKIDATIDHPTVSTFGDRPMDIDQLLQRTYEVPKDSKRYQTLVLGRLKKVAAEKEAAVADIDTAADHRSSADFHSSAAKV